MSNLNHPHGRLVARRNHFAWMLLGLAALLFSACGSPAPAGAPAPSTSPATAPAPSTQSVNPPAATGAAVLSEDPRTAVSNAMRAQLKAMPFRAVQTFNSGGTQMKTTVEFESAQRVLVVSPTSSLKLVDGKCYEKQADVWRDCPAGGASAMAGFLSMVDEASVGAFVEMIKTVKLIGAEQTDDGIPARVYEYTYAGNQFGIETQGTVRLWLAEDDNLPIQQVTTSEAAGYSSTMKQSIDYDPTITVRAP